MSGAERPDFDDSAWDVVRLPHDWAIAGPVHVAHWGTYVTTPEVNDDAATVRVRSTIENYRDAQKDVDVEIMLLDPSGQAVASSKRKGVDIIPATGSCEIERSFTVANPQRWDITSPGLYAAPKPQPCISCPTGIGPIGSSRKFQCSSTPTATFVMSWWKHGTRKVFSVLLQTILFTSRLTDRQRSHLSAMTIPFRWSLSRPNVMICAKGSSQAS